MQPDETIGIPVLGAQPAHERWAPAIFSHRLA
jgi:hypothetical protein